MNDVNFNNYFETLKGKPKSFKFRKKKLDINEFFSPNFFDELEPNSEIIFEGVEFFDPFKNVIFRDLNIYFSNIKTIPVLNIFGENCNIYFKNVKGSPEDILIKYGDFVNLELKGEFNFVQLSEVSYNHIKLSITGKADKISIEKSHTNDLEIVGGLSGKINSLSIIEFNSESIIKKITVDAISIDYFHMRGLTNLNNILFKKTKIKDKLIIGKCIISTIEFDAYMVFNFSLKENVINKVFINIEDELCFNDNGQTGFSEFNVNNIKSKKTRIKFMKIKQNSYVEFNEFNLEIVDNFLIENMKCRNFQLNNTIEKESFIFGCTFQNITFSNFYTSSILNIKNLKLKKDINSLNIKNSNLDNVMISPSIFENLKKISFVKSSIHDLKVTNFTDIPSKTLIPETRDNETNYLILYRELKGLAQSYGDNYLYHKFKALEYNERLKEKLNLLDRSVLEFNKFTNNHTTDWFRAFKLLLITFSFYLYLITSYLLYSNNDFQFMDISTVLPTLLSPVGFLVNNTKYFFPNFIYFIDILYNIIIGLLFYQMIAAFRKFNR